MSNDTTTTVTSLDSGTDFAAAKVATKAAKSAQPKTDAPESAGGKMYQISIQSSPTDSTAVKVQVNGHMTLIPRDTAVWVKEEVYEVLQNAMTMVYDQEGNGKPSYRHSVSVLNTKG